MNVAILKVAKGPRRERKIALGFEGWVEGVSIAGKSTSYSMRVTMACRHKGRKEEKEEVFSGLVRKKCT